MLNYRSLNSLQKKLRNQGWFVEWQFDEVTLPEKHIAGPDMGKQIDTSRILFCRTKDYGYRMTCLTCAGKDKSCVICDGRGNFVDPDYDFEGAYFQFGESDESIAHLIDDVLPALQKSECNYDWDILGGNRIFISWARKDPIVTRVLLTSVFIFSVLFGSAVMVQNCGKNIACYTPGLSGLTMNTYVKNN